MPRKTERVTVKVNYWNESGKVVKESWRFHHWMDTSFADIFGAVQDKIQEASLESLLFSFNGEWVYESDTPAGVGMTTEHTQILGCFDRIDVKIKHRGRSELQPGPEILKIVIISGSTTFGCTPCTPFRDLLSAYADAEDFDISGGDLITFKYDRRHVGGDLTLSILPKRDFRLIAYTFKNRFNWKHEIDACFGIYSSPFPTPNAATMMNWLAPPGTSITSWRSEVTKAEALRLGRIIEHWPYPLEDVVDDIAHSLMQRFIAWEKAIGMRTAVRDDCAHIFQRPVTAEATSRLQVSCLHQQNEELNALSEGWEQWRTDLLEDWDRQQSRFLHGYHALCSLQRALHNNTVARLQREAIIVFILGELTQAWKPTSFRAQDFNRDLITLQNKAKGLSLAVLIEEWKRKRKGTTDAIVPRKTRTLRNEIQRRWNKASQNAGAAGIEFINEIDEEEVPPNIGILFLYLEKSYRLNRVSQRPRQVPIQIFKTSQRGWGAQATINIVKGSMVGIYTGLILWGHTLFRFLTLLTCEVGDEKTLQACPALDYHIASTSMQWRILGPNRIHTPWMPSLAVIGLGSSKLAASERLRRNQFNLPPILMASVEYQQSDQLMNKSIDLRPNLDQYEMSILNKGGWGNLNW
ncbi:hypothetical protein B0H11DRAFT_2199743 [Mycena galericulata]|nr:hypothetical protein B0H11DRAFT_2199743 [Mycena galericulata]